MKTISIKSILVLSLIISILFPVSSFAAIQSTNEQITEVIYEPLCMSYFALTEDHDGQWVIHLMSAENGNKAILNSLNAILKGKRIHIMYDDMGTKDADYWEIVDWTILE